MTILDSALEYARRGWPVFPCKPTPDKAKGSKMPLVAGADKDPLTGVEIKKTGGHWRATTDEAVIREWWRKNPDALIGLPSGFRTNLLVIDLDPDGESVEEVEARLVGKVGDLGNPPRIRTQSGGNHLWYAMPDGEAEPPKNQARRGIRNVDWRSEGGYVIAPPSVMSNGARYEWISGEGEIPPAPPARLLDFIYKRGEFAPPKREVKKPNTSQISSDGGAVSKYCMAIAERHANDIRNCRPGSRNQTINDAAINMGHYVPHGISRDIAYSVLYDACIALGLQDDDKALKRGGTLDRALDAGMAEPADLSGIGNNRRVVEEFRQELPPHDMETGEIYDPDPEYHVNGFEPDKAKERPFPFRFLGYNKDLYFYLPDGKRQVVALKANEHVPLRLLAIAPLPFWEKSAQCFKGEKISEHAWQQIANGLIRSSEAEGIFEESRLRGRGAWIDGEKVIVHTGNEATIDGQVYDLPDLKSKFIYEAAPAWEFELGEPATTAEAHRLVDIAERLTWQEPLSAALLVGWCIVSPVSGALKWRPHIWITGPSQSGKTTAINDIVGRIVGPAAERFDGKATEAAIRQLMGYDARPVIFDEAESEDQAGMQRMQSVLDLARVSSSGGRIPKGGANHIAKTFIIRSCFCFASINTSLRHYADESRVSRLVLIPNPDEDKEAHYVQLMQDITTWFTRDFASALFARTVRYLPTLLKNAEIFTTAAAMVFKSRRAADQIGPMLAGYYLCHSPNVVSVETATAFIKKHNWAEYVALDAATDEMRLFQFVMSRMIRVNVAGSAREMSVGQALKEAITDDGSTYSSALGPRGLRIFQGKIAVANKSDGLQELMRSQPQWANDWKRPMSMIEGAEKCDKAVYFAPGLVQKAVLLPLDLLRE